MSDEMRVDELIELLQEQTPEAVVRIVHQRSWPLQEVIGGLACGEDLYDGEDEEAGEGGEAAEAEQVVYLVADGQPGSGSPYGSRAAWDVMRRR